ncbi:asparaginase [Aquabacterium parvum]|uniref:asparaginase n=1 Tax=Aquabacterium parvum TaxID=70584 RepID=UPI000718BA91|nr:asparaginase [Aquabacterium parvum]
MPNVLILGTGGTIAGTASDPNRSWAYRAAQLSVAKLVSAVPDLAGIPLVTLQVAQVDSKDMGWATWQALGRALEDAMRDDTVSAIVITHGTDTLEETACLLHALHDGRKPIVLTAAMRPATAPDADGPANLTQAVRLAQAAAQRGEGGVAVAVAGRTWSARDVRKAHSHAIDAFDGGGAEVLDERAPWPQPEARGWRWLQFAQPPRVEVVTSHADADGWLVDAALAHAQSSGQKLDGVVVACTGHGTVHEELEAALQRARDAGVAVWRSSRVARGGVQPREGDTWPAAGNWTPAQARVRLLLELLSARR